MPRAIKGQHGVVPCAAALRAGQLPAACHVEGMPDHRGIVTRPRRGHRSQGFPHLARHIVAVHLSLGGSALEVLAFRGTRLLVRLDLSSAQSEFPTVNATELRSRRQITLPADVCEAIGLSVTDLVDWSCEGGRIIGRRLETSESLPVTPVRRQGRLMLPRMLDGAEIAQAVRRDRDAR